MKSCKDFILKQLEGQTSMAGGVLEDNVRDIAGYKSSTVSRVARGMAEDGIIQRGLFRIANKKCVYYRAI